MIKESLMSCLFILMAILLGGTCGVFISEVQYLSEMVDYLILALVFLVFIDVPLKKVIEACKQPKVLLLMWLTNFMVLPLLGFTLTQLFLADGPLIALGLSIYFMSPCTDWFLGFTRISKGNVALGSILLPINMLTQLLLYPFYLNWFSQTTITTISIAEISGTLFNWFLVPVIAALLVKSLTYKYFKGLRKALTKLTNWVIYLLIFMVFSVNINQIADNLTIFISVLITVVVFFIFTLGMTELIAYKLKLERSCHVLYTMTTSARNAPLMLGLTMTAIPGQPLIYAAIIIGMLIEFPYLSLQVLRFNTNSLPDRKALKTIATE